MNQVMEEQTQTKEALRDKVAAVRKSAYGNIHVRALVIDDSPIDRLLRARVLQNVGCDSVDVVESGEAALQQISTMAAQKISYHIIACDYDLSGDANKLNGAKCVLLFRGMPQCKDVLIWCISARIENMKMEIDDGLALLPKPFFSQEILFTAKGKQTWNV